MAGELEIQLVQQQGQSAKDGMPNTQVQNYTAAHSIVRDLPSLLQNPRKHRRREQRHAHKHNTTPITGKHLHKCLPLIMHQGGRADLEKGKANH